MGTTTNGSERITLDRANLLRMAEVLREGGVHSAENEAQRAFMDGWAAAADALARIAEEMPVLYGDNGYFAFSPAEVWEAGYLAADNGRDADTNPYR